jgi:secreted trypsin-like serine protease
MKIEKKFVMVLTMVLISILAHSGQAEDSQSPSPTILPRIVGGEPVTSPYEYPWMVALGNVIDGVFMANCGGSFIGDKWILTASHCVVFEGDKEDMDDLHILIGALDLLDPQDGEIVKVKRVIPHPDFYSETISSDIALLELEKPLTDYTPVELYRGTDTLAGNSGTVIGWGETQGYTPPKTKGAEKQHLLRDVSLSIITNEQCEQANGRPVDDTMLCAGVEGGGKDSCQGDSGGPLVIQDKGGWKQVGVVSWGAGMQCAEPGLYGAYARVSAAVGFIDEYTTGISIYGKITTALAGHEELGIKDALVSLEGTDYIASTDENGKFSLVIAEGNISAGDYTVSISADGFNLANQSIPIEGQAGESIEVNKKLEYDGTETETETGTETETETDSGFSQRIASGGSGNDRGCFVHSLWENILTRH